MELFGLLFDSLVIRDLRVYAQASDADRTDRHEEMRRACRRLRRRAWHHGEHEHAGLCEPLSRLT